MMDTVLETFFDTYFLGKYVENKASEFENSDFLGVSRPSALLPLSRC